MDMTCIYATARQTENAMKGRDDDHIKLFLDCLAKQTFPLDGFEAIIADCYYSYRSEHVVDNTYKGVKYPFRVLHFEVKSPWLDRGCWAGQAPWNQAALLASGELLCLFGDCCEPPEDYLSRIWTWYLNGYWPMSLVIYKKNGGLFYIEESDLKTKIGGNIVKLRERGFLKDILRDSRWKFVETAPTGVVKWTGEQGGQQFHGFSTIPLNALLEINGFDENFDGDKALGDCDAGIRAAVAGYDDVLLLDKDLWIYENSHVGIPKELLFYKGDTVRSNYSLMILNQNKKRYLANSYTLTEEEVDWICLHGRNWGFKDIDQRDNPLFMWWVENPPLFDMKELRWEVQEKLDQGIVEIPRYYSN